MVPDTFQQLLADIRKQEGGRLHYNRSESDITTGYGIYRAANPKAEVFKYIDNVARDIGIKTPSKNWNNIDILNRVNDAIDPDEELEYTYLFYKEYFAPVCLDQVHEVLVPVIASLYTNGTKFCITTIQRALNKIYTKYDLDPSYRVMGVDGSFGPITKKWYLDLQGYGDTINLEFRYLLLVYAKSYYINLATKAPDKYLQYLTGWDNRVNNLL